jgi:DNA polymerase-1
MVYIKYPVKYSLIYEQLNKNNYEKVTFFIDLQSIAKGLYSLRSIEEDISFFDENGYVNTLPYELFEYLRNIEKRFKNYDPFFVIFYDNGVFNYHWMIYKEYKRNRHYDPRDAELVHIFKKVKEYYFNVIEREFNKYDNCAVLFIRNYEADFIPYALIKYGYFESNDPKNLNIILSSDKDLLQCLTLNNTMQYVVTYNQKKYRMELYDKNNWFMYLCDSEKYRIAPEYLPLILSIAGDQSDNIPGIKGYGFKKAVELIKLYDLRYDLSNIEKITSKVDVKLIERNYKLVSFEVITNKVFNNVKKYVDFICGEE